MTAHNPADFAHRAATDDAHAIGAVTGLQAALDGKASAGDLAAHTGAVADAHAASAISVVDSGGLFTGTTVEATLAEAGRKVLVGSGSPLSVVTPAYVGQLYSDTAQTNGARLWVATTTASSGWRVVDGDTGRRDIKTMLTNGFAAVGWLYMRRIQSRVVVDLYINPAGRTNSGPIEEFLTAPYGFRPQSGSSAFVGAGGYAAGLVNLDWVGTGALRRIVGRSTYNLELSFAGTVTWDTADPWPTTLPGTAA